MQNYLISWGCLHFNNTDVSFALLDLLIVPEENGSIYLNPVEFFLKYLSSGQYYPLSKQEGISPLLILEDVFGVLLHVFLCLMKNLHTNRHHQCILLFFFFELN